MLDADDVEEDGAYDKKTVAQVGNVQTTLVVRSSPLRQSIDCHSFD